MYQDMSAQYFTAQIVRVDIILEKGVSDFGISAVHKAFLIQVDYMEIKFLCQFNLYIRIILPVFIDVFFVLLHFIGIGDYHVDICVRMQFVYLLERLINIAAIGAFFQFVQGAKVFRTGKEVVDSGKQNDDICIPGNVRICVLRGGAIGISS